MQTLFLIAATVFSYANVISGDNVYLVVQEISLVSFLMQTFLRGNMFIYPVLLLLNAWEIFRLFHLKIIKLAI